jgi:hypothetical protein
LTTGDKHVTARLRLPAATGMERPIWLLYALVGVAILQSALVLRGNEPNQSVWLLALLAAGIGQALLLPSRFAWFGGLAAVVLWVMFRQATGVWVRAQLLQGLLEVLGLSLSIVLAVRFRRVWEELQQEVQELVALRQVLVAGEAGTGLLPQQVAELRLLEEVDRARQFRRPLGLLLVEIDQLPEMPVEQIGPREVHQAVVRQLVSASLVQDIPFRIDLNRVGLIMPERDWASLYRDTEAIVTALKGASFLDGNGRSQNVVRCARLSFGLGTYQGEASGTIDLMRAAEDSLNVSRDLAGIDEASVTAYAMPASPIIGARLAAADEEE